MKTRYADFKKWLIDNNMIDVIHELQSAYPAQMGEDSHLWNLNDWCDPLNDIIVQNEEFFHLFDSVQDIHIIGHSCGEMDFPYF